MPFGLFLTYDCDKKGSRLIYKESQHNGKIQIICINKYVR